MQLILDDEVIEKGLKPGILVETESKSKVYIALWGR